MKLGMTLAEVLITLTILGIIFVTAMPVLNISINDKPYKVQAKKTYAMLTNAMDMSILNGQSDSISISFDSDDAISNWFNAYLKPYLQVQKTCVNTRGCWNSGDTYYLKGGKVKYNKPGIGVGNSILTVVLNDGTFLNIDSYYYENTKNFFGIDIPAGSSSLVIFFDVNGDKRPNTLGRDIFVAVFDGEQLIPPYRDYPDKINEECSKTGKGYSCLNKIISDEL